MLRFNPTTWSILTVLVASTWLKPVLPVRAQDIDETKALQVKAAFLYNFAKFIEWPDDATENAESPFIIGVLGKDPFGPILDATVKNRKIAQRLVKIRRLTWSKTEDRAALLGCHILYISNSERGRLNEVLTAMMGRPIPLVSDIPGFAGQGGMIGLVLRKQRISFEINREALQQAHLKASAKLLKLATIVTQTDYRPAR